jgi:undecaprenyl diphosphate synthase
MRLLVDTISSEMETFHRNNIRLNAFGSLEDLPLYCNKGLSKAMNETAHHSGLTLNLALSYSARNELVHAARILAERVQSGALRAEDIDVEQIAASTYTSGMPDPELLIRTSGEQRVSNFLLWQLAYTELYFTSVLWPDFKKEHLYHAISDYLTRERRFGKTGQQIQKI